MVDLNKGHDAFLIEIIGQDLTGTHYLPSYVIIDVIA